MTASKLSKLIDEHNALQPHPVVSDEPEPIRSGIMKVRIEVPGIYAEWNGIKQGARKFEVGEVITYPAWYGQGLIDDKMAVRVDESGPQDVVIMTEPEVIEVPQPVDDEPEWAKVNATKDALALAEKEGIVLAGIVGSGKGSKVTVADVRELAGE